MNANTNKRVLLVLATLLVGSVLVGCPLKKKKPAPEEEDDPNAAAAAVADAATTTVSGTGAKNEKAVLRYAQEEPLNGEAAVIGRDGTKARNFPGNGPEVATLNKGTAVVKIAKYFSTGVLVEFTDPAGDGNGNLIGWVAPHSFADLSVVATTKPVVVPPTITTVTTVKDAGGGTSPTTTVKDAGGSAPLAVADAGGGGGAASDDPWSAANLKYKIATPARDGKCPPGFAFIVGSCRRLCVNDLGCSAVRGTFCVQKSWSPNKYCSTDK